MASPYGAMWFWNKGDLVGVNTSLGTRGLRKSAAFASVVQAIREMAATGSEDRLMQEKLQNHLGRGRPSGQFREATQRD